MFSYMYDLNKYDLGSSRSSCGSMGQLGSSCGPSSRRGSSRDHLRRSKSVHLMEVVSERRPKSHRFWRERRVVGDVSSSGVGQVRLIDLEAALPHTNYSAWCLSFDGEPNLNSVRIRFYLAKSTPSPFTSAKL